jgi:FixJ family two-component response regulator
VPETSSVVLVEDDEDVRHGTAQALELAGFAVAGV